MWVSWWAGFHCPWLIYSKQMDPFRLFLLLLVSHFIIHSSSLSVNSHGEWKPGLWSSLLSPLCPLRSLFGCPLLCLLFVLLSSLSQLTPWSPVSSQRSHYNQNRSLWRRHLEKAASSSVTDWPAKMLMLTSDEDREAPSLSIHWSPNSHHQPCLDSISTWETCSV